MRSLRRRYGEAERDRGAALVEAAILLPLLVLLVFGIIDVGRLVFTKIDVHDAAQEGSLFAAYNPSNATNVQTRVIDSGDDLGLASGDVVVTCPETGVIAITVSKDMSMITPLFTGTTITLSSKVEANILGADACQAS